MANMADYAAWLREQRESVSPRLSQAQLGREAGLTGAYISRLEMMDQAGVKRPIIHPGEQAVDAISRVLERYTGRPLVNEARAVIGFRELQQEEAEQPRGDRYALPNLSALRDPAQRYAALALFVSSLRPEERRFMATILQGERSLLGPPH
ncbi:MAG: hypothetical protein ACO1SX_20185 [Actinomycetota bacterium]